MLKTIIIGLSTLIAGCTLEVSKLNTYNKYSTIIVEKIRVIDGDTIEITSLGKKDRIRLVGIDAPELIQPDGYASTVNLYKCLINTHVTIKWQKRDMYNRILGTVYANGKDCNLYQVQKGYAWHYKQYQNEQPEKQRLAYSNAEIFAKQNKIGLWNQVCVQAPWNWRHKKPFTCDNKEPNL